MLRTLLLWTVFSVVAAAAPIQISTSQLFVHGSSGLLGQYSPSSGSYFSNLDGQNQGQYGWTFTNSGSATLTDLRFIVFLDADLDRDDNTFFNEYGEFVGLALPPSVTLAIGASGWEIDEPGFLYGNIYSNAFSGFLDNENGVTSAFPDDVSMALSFTIGALDPGRTATVTLVISSTSINGLRQLDADSVGSFYWNGYANLNSPASPENPIPEPLPASLLAGGATAFFLVRLRAAWKGFSRV